MPRPDAEALLGHRAVRLTGQAIAAVQERNGAIPWFVGGHLDPWDHVQSAMGLDLAGRHEEALRAYSWVARHQRPDGSLANRYRNGRPEVDVGDASCSTYLAVGVWHHMLVTGDTSVAHRFWPAVRDAVEFALGLQRAGGEVVWIRDRHGNDWHEALLTCNASIYLSLRCALAIAAEVGDPQPSWELSAGRLGHAVAFHEERFADRRRYSMDWYYPVLGGALRGMAARHRLDEDWDRFVVDGLGIRCVDDRPWVTGAETCELALALSAIDETDRAVSLIEAMQHLRDPRGSYWTGLVWPDHARWPVERTAWTAATVLMAADAVAGGPTLSLFAGEDLPLGVHPEDVACEDEVCLEEAQDRALR